MRQSNFLRSAALCTFGVMLMGCMHCTYKSAEGKPESGIATINLVGKSLAITSVDNDDTLLW